MNLLFVLLGITCVLLIVVLVLFAVILSSKEPKRNPPYEMHNHDINKIKEQVL